MLVEPGIGRGGMWLELEVAASLCVLMPGDTVNRWQSQPDKGKTAKGSDPSGLRPGPGYLFFIIEE